MEYKSQAELAGLLMSLGFRLFKGYMDGHQPHIVAAGVNPELRQFDAKNEAVVLHCCGALGKAQTTRRSNPRLYLRTEGSPDFTLALDEFGRYWVAPGKKDLQAFTFSPAQRLLAG